MPDRPQIVLDFTTSWCPGHAEPFRANWPAGAPAATVQLLEEVLHHPDIVAACGGVEGAQADAQQLTGVLIEYGPLCCLVDAEALQRVYAAGGVEP